MDISDWINAAIAGGALVISLIVSMVTLTRTAWIEMRNKRIEVLIHCIARYETLSRDFPDQKSENPAYKNAESKVQNAVQSPTETANAQASYFRRLWAIKKEQVDFWIAGYVDPSDIFSWLMTDVDYFSENTNLKITSREYKQGWEEVKKHHGLMDDDFIEIVENLQKIAIHPDRSSQQRELFMMLERIENQRSREIRRLRGHIGRSWFRELRSHGLLNEWARL